MRLINTRTLDFAEFLGPTTPPYAILSHTWEEEEVSLQDMRLALPSLSYKKGYRKVVDYCRLAAQQGFAWAWVDTCCIDKTNHAELAESINSMFRWYQEAAVCHVFLSDLPADAGLETALPRCRWFTRGWTLQELIAPSMVEFYDQSWVKRGTKRGLIAELEAITGIPGIVLDGTMRLREVCVGVRMSWAANRETTRLEDVAYSLLGIFDVNMPMIYGEGQKAFRRLQEEIIRQSNDLTIFAWVEHGEHSLRGSVESNNEGAPQSAPLLALSPQDFGSHSARRSLGFPLLRRLKPGYAWKWSDASDPEYSITNMGLRITACLVSLDASRESWSKGPLYFLVLGTIMKRPNSTQEEMIGIILDKQGPDLFSRRRSPLCVVPFTEVVTTWSTPPTIYIGMGDDSFHHITRGWPEVLRVRAGHVPVLSDAANSTQAGCSPDRPSHAVVRIMRAVPERNWDRTNQRFFRALDHPSVLAFSVGITLSEQAISLICFVGRPEGRKPCLFHPMKHPELNRWFLSTKGARENTFWEDLPDDWLQWPGPQQSLDVEFAGVLYTVTVKEGVNYDPVESPRWEILFEIVRHDAAEVAPSSQRTRTRSKWKRS